MTYLINSITLKLEVMGLIGNTNRCDEISIKIQRRYNNILQSTIDQNNEK